MGGEAALVYTSTTMSSTETPDPKLYVSRRTSVGTEVEDPLSYVWGEFEYLKEVGGGLSTVVDTEGSTSTRHRLGLPTRSRTGGGGVRRLSDKTQLWLYAVTLRVTFGDDPRNCQRSIDWHGVHANFIKNDNDVPGV